MPRCDLLQGDARPKSVLSHKRLPGSELAHPTQKPVPLMRELISALVPENGTVLDPFMGSGSTAVAAFLENRHFIGMELDAEYVRIAQQRVAEAAA